MTSTQPTYSAALLRYISSYEIAPDNTIVLNTLDRELDFVSRYYTPRLKISELASFVLKDIESEKIQPKKSPPSKGSFLDKMLTNNIRYTDNNLYQLGKTILLECFSIMYTINYKNSYVIYLSESDIRQARTNIIYFIDAIGSKEEYHDLKDDLYEFDISLGYIQGQIPVLKEQLGGVVNG